jgi:hypothetical protein
VINPITRLLSRVARVVRHAWSQSLAAQELWIEINRPWRKDGEFRWVRRGGGWELQGSRLPEIPAMPREPAAD